MVARVLCEALEDRRMLSAHSVQGNTYVVADLVSNQPGGALVQDPQLVNPWGLAASPTGPWWVADNAGGVSTIYNGSGVEQAAPVTVPPPPGSPNPARPTGLIANNTSDFVVSANGQSAPAQFIFATESGTISGWSPSVDSSNAIIAANESATGALYKGLASGSVGANHFLYATDFHNRKITVFDAHFSPVTMPGQFVDPNLPATFAPFGISNIGGKLYVSYAVPDASGSIEVNGPGNGFVDVFTTTGQFVRRFATQGRLNSPWGMVMAPSNFGQFANDILIGNFGDGRINAYDPRTGRFRGQLADSHKQPITIPGLWSLQFGNNQAAGSSHSLFFTAGPATSVFGSIAVKTASHKKGGKHGVGHKPSGGSTGSTGGSGSGGGGGQSGGGGTSGGGGGSTGGGGSGW